MSRKSVALRPWHQPALPARRPMLPNEAESHIHSISQPWYAPLDTDALPRVLPEHDEPSGLAAAAAHLTVRMLRSIDARAAGRILVLEPASGNVAETLRHSGHAGERWAVVRRPTPTLRSTPRAEQVFDHVLLYDWHDRREEPDEKGQTERRTAASVDGSHGMHNQQTVLRIAGSDYVVAHDPVVIGQFEAILALQLLRHLSPNQYQPVLRWLTSLLTPLGYLVLGEPSPPADMAQWGPALAESGLLLAADECRLDDSWTWQLAAFQYRPGDAGRLVGALRSVTATEIVHTPAVRTALVASYRDIFGGDEWREWMRCVRPGCGRHYSKREYDVLDPPTHCVCGWTEPLQPYYTDDDVLQKLQTDLADPKRSRCYLKVGPDDAVQAFIWGYIASDEQVLRHLLPLQEEEITSWPMTADGPRPQTLLAHVRGRLHKQASARNMMGHTETAELVPEEVYYQSEIGIREGIRSLSLVRTLFYRVCQFAFEQGVRVVITRTSRRSSGYALLRGIGMQVLYRYDGGPVDDAPGRDVVGEPAQGTQTTHLVEEEHRRQGRQGPERITTQHDRQSEADERVVLCGNVAQLVAMMSGESDRRLAVRMARQLQLSRQHTSA